MTDKHLQRSNTLKSDSVEEQPSATGVDSAGRRPRDPRIDPKPGDVLKVAARNRGIRRHLLRRVTYAVGTWKGWPNAVRYTDGIVDKYCLLPAWKRWAKNAEVIHAAE
jgi:hypothetical protein